MASLRWRPTSIETILRKFFSNLKRELNSEMIADSLYVEYVIDLTLKQEIEREAEKKGHTRSANDRLLCHLIQNGTPETLTRFCDVLEETGKSMILPHHTKWSKELRVSLREIFSSPSSEEQANRPFTSNLQACSQLAHDQQKRFELLKEVVQDSDMPVMDFVQLAVIERKERPRLKKEKDIEGFLHASVKGIDRIYEQSCSIDYGRILDFSSQDRGKRIIISGAPGCGKSTLARKLCKDLSSKYLPNGYYLILLIELRELNLLIQQRGPDVDVQLHHLLEACYSKADLLQASKECEQCDGKGILMVIDGYDELSPKIQESPFWRRLFDQSKMYLYQCDIVVTTRPVVCHELLDLMTPLHRMIEILGFPVDSIKCYIRRFFQRDSHSEATHQTHNDGSSIAEALIQRLKHLPQVKGLCHIPVVLKIVCEVCSYLGIKDLPHSMTGIYKEYVHRQLPTPSVKNFLNVPRAMLPVFYQLCELAYHSSIEQKLVLSEDDLGELAEHVDERGTIYSLLLCDPVWNPRLSIPLQLFHFVHKTAQEFLAAVHISSLDPLKRMEIWQKYFGVAHMSEVWKFFCGLTKLADIDVSSIIGSGGDTEDTHKLHVISFFEADSSDLATRELPKIFPDEVDICLSSSYETAALNYILKHHRSLHRLTLRSVTIDTVNLELAAEVIVQHPDLKEFECFSLPPGDWEVCSSILRQNHTIKKVILHDPPLDTFLAALSADSTHEDEFGVPEDCTTVTWETLDDGGLKKLERACSLNRRSFTCLDLEEKVSLDLISALVRGTIQRQDKYAFSITAFHDVESDYNYVDLVKGKCDWILVDRHSLLVTNTTLKPGDCEVFPNYFGEETPLECHTSLTNCCSMICDICETKYASIGSMDLFFDSDYSGISDEHLMELEKKWKSSHCTIKITTSSMDEVFLVELNRFCCSIARGNVGKDLDWSLMLIADPGVLDKCALVDTAKDKRHWIWNGHSLLFYTKDSYLDIREDRFSEYLSKCSHSSLALECHMSLLDYCHIVLIKTCHVIDLTFDIHFTDGNGQFAHDDIMDFCEYYKYRWSKTTHPRTLNINIDVPIENQLMLVNVIEENDSRQLAHYAIMDVCEELEYKWSESTHPRTLNINITGYDCEEEEEREEFLGQVNHFCCSLVKVVVQCQDEYKFVLSAVAGILDKHALVGLVKNVLMCQWKWDEVGHKTVLTVTNSSKYPNQLNFPPKDPLMAYLDDISLDDELFEGITFPQQTLDCEQDQSGLVSLCPPSSVHPSHPSQSLLTPPLPPAQPSSLSYTQTTEASQTDGCQDHPTSATSNDQQHHLSSDLPNPYSMHSVVHNCGHSTEQEPEVRKDEAVARQSKGKDTRGKIPQKSSSVPHVELPPNKRTRQMPPTDQL